MWDRRGVMRAGAAVGFGAIAASAFAQDSSQERIEVDLSHEAGALDHIWSRCAGSDRAIITLREEWRSDLKRFHDEAGLERVRFHGIFADEMGILSGYGVGNEPNWQNVDAVYDGLIERGVDPFVELSFMPQRLASGTAKFGFYGANITPPKDLGKWQQFVAAFMRHLVARYGPARVRRWYVEVWNEPNLPFFWSGTQSQYIDLYRASAAAVKEVDAAIRVGGPSTAAVEWIPSFLNACSAERLPVDFVSTHLYAGDDQKKLFGEADRYPQYDVIPAAMAQARAQIDATPFKGTELWLSEWSSDSPAMIAHVLANSLPYAQAMSQWTLSNVFEELNVGNFILKEGDNGWGMLARHGIAKPAFNTYKLLNRLGTRRLHATGPALASRTLKGAAILVWNLADVRQPSGIPGVASERKVTGERKRFEVVLHGAGARRTASVSYVDLARGSPFPEWRRLGSPQYPSRGQIEAIRAAAELALPERRRLDSAGMLSLDLPPEGVALVELD